MRLALALFGIVVGLLLAEGAARVFDRVVCRDDPGMFREPSREVGWVHTPGAEGWAQRCLRGKPEWRVYTRINSRGLRDREIPYERQGAYRILLLGDSYTEGLQVPAEQTLAKLLEQRLGTADAPVEVLNAGVSGYGTDNELLYYLHEGWKYHPDLVVAVFDTSNDVLENHNGLMRGTNFPYPDKPYFDLEDGRLVARRLPLPELGLADRASGFVHRALSRHSTLYRLLPVLNLVGPGDAHAADLEPVRGTVQPEVYLVDYPESWRVAWRITRGLVLKLRQAVEARGSRFAVVVLNAKEEVSDRRWRWMLHSNPPLRSHKLDADKPNRLITSFLARRGIAAIPLLETFRAYFKASGTSGYFETSGYYELDVHWSPGGHELAANAVARDLRRLGLVPPAGR